MKGAVWAFVGYFTVLIELVLAFCLHCIFSMDKTLVQSLQNIIQNFNYVICNPALPVGKVHVSENVGMPLASEVVLCTS